MPISVRVCAAVFVFCAFLAGAGIATTAASSTERPLLFRKKASPTPSPTATATATATPSPLPSPSEIPSEVPASGTSDEPVVNITVGAGTPVPRVTHESLYDFVGAPWECITFGGTKFTHEFSRTDDTQTILVDTVVTVKAKTLRLQEKFVHSAAKGRWNVDIASGNVKASAPEWTGKTWTFDGVSTDGGKAKKIRMTFTMIGKDQYRRDFENLDGGVWTTYAGENCDRPL